MKILIVSDIHGRGDLLCDLLELHRDRDGLVFLGDGIRDIFTDVTANGRKWFSGVAGNCDWMSFSSLYDFPEETFISADGFKILLMHGHTRGVKSGIEKAAVYASKSGADILLFGHTHRPLEKYISEESEIDGYAFSKPLWIFNPGSLSEHSYGLLQTKNGQLLFSHGSIK